MHLKNLIGQVSALTVIFLIGGCHHSAEQFNSVPPMYPASASKKTEAILIKKASLSLSASDVKATAAKIEDITKKFEGYIENQNISDEQRASMKVHVPSEKLTEAMAEYETAGKVLTRNVWTEDVTAKYIDLEAKLKNLNSTRDRLKQLFDKSQNIQDTLSVERELTRVQTEIDTIEGNLKVLKNQISYASIEINVRQAEILGPLGYFFKGLWWGTKKLFVIQ